MVRSLFSTISLVFFLTLAGCKSNSTGEEASVAPVEGITASEALQITPYEVTIGVSDTVDFTTENAVGSVRFIVSSGSGAVDFFNGRFTPSGVGDVEVIVTDDAGKTSTAVIHVQ